MKKIWKKWCDRVDKHNNSLTYVNADEACGPGIIFMPLICVAITFLPFACTGRIVEGFWMALLVLVITTFFVYQNTKS